MLRAEDRWLNSATGQAQVDRAGEMTEIGDNNAFESALHAAARVTRYVSKYSQMAERGTKSFRPYVAKSLKQRPMITLAAGAMVVFVLGALWRK